MKLPLSRWMRWSDVALFVIAAVLVAYYVMFGGGAGFPLDDSWIHQTYGRNLAYTGQWAFVPDVPSAASTAPLYTLLLALGYAVGVPYFFWTNLLGALALGAAAVFGARLAEMLAPRRGIFAGLALLFTWHLVWAAASGMETMLFCAFTLLLPLLAWREVGDRSAASRALIVRGAVFGAAAALATLTRPEGILMAGLCGLALLIARRQSAVIWGVGAAVGFGVVIAPYLIYNVNLTGGLLPDTAAAKMAENAPLLEVHYFGRVVNMLYPLSAGFGALLIPAVVAYVIGLRRRVNVAQMALYLVPLVWTVALIAVYAARLPAPYQHGRYVIPALPTFVVCGVIGMAWLLEMRIRQLFTRAALRALALAIPITGLFFTLLTGAAAFRQDVRIINEEMVIPAQWIAAHLPHDELLAVHDIGAVGYFASRPILDLAGLVSPEVVPFILEKEPLYTWMESNGASYLMALPDQLPGDDIHDARLCPIYSSGGEASPAAGGANMMVYRLAWDEVCAS